MEIKPSICGYFTKHIFKDGDIVKVEVKASQEGSAIPKLTTQAKSVEATKPVIPAPKV